MRQERVVLVCDIHGREGDDIATRTIGLDGEWGEIDACTEDWDELMTNLQPFIDAARRQKARR